MFWIAGCDRAPLLVGFSGTLTGLYSDLGIHGRNGARMAVEDINAAGGLYGRKLELVVVDDTGRPQGAAEAARRLAAQGVLAVIGHMTSSMTMAALPVMEELGVPLISPTTSTPLLSGRKDLFFRVQPASNVAGRFLAHWITGKPGLRSVCTVRDMSNDAFSEPWESAFVEEYERLGGRVSCRFTYTTLEPSFLTTMINHLNATGPDVVLFVSSARDTARMVQSLHEAEVPSLLISSNWAQTDALLADLGALSMRILFAADNPTMDSSAALREFSWRYRKRFGMEPSFAAARAYEAVRFLATAWKEAEERGERLVEALSRPRTLEGLFGSMQIDAFGDASGAYFMVGVKNGRFTVLEWLAGDVT